MSDARHHFTNNGAKCNKLWGWGACSRAVGQA